MQIGMTRKRIFNSWNGAHQSGAEMKEQNFGLWDRNALDSGRYATERDLNGVLSFRDTLKFFS